MNSEIQIILEDKNPYKQGNCFERIVREIIESHRYEVSSNINFTGMELDLIGKHKDRPNETLYVECKAKEKVSSAEILTFESKVRFKKVNYGYFIRTKELEHQAKGIVEEMQADERYNHITFFEPKKVIKLLQESGQIKTATEFPKKITKSILAITYFGDYYIHLIKDSLGSVPKSFYLINAKTAEPIDDDKNLEILKEKIPSIKNLDIELISAEKTEPTLEKQKIEIESISEVQESENWYDYLPASTKHIVGRDQIRTDIFNFFNKALSNESNRRVFYLTGKSGWGKSSLVADLKGRCRNKYYKNKYYSLAIDSRSALSSNFVALSFEKLIKKAISDSFIKTDLFAKEISFTSTFDLLNSESVKELLKYLKQSNKILILIFDQFEDIFRKDDLFKTFYKFLADVTDLKGNLIVGFSWKTEILIPSENEAYHLWQQAKEQAEAFSIPEFGSKETNGIILQLEKSIGKVDTDIKRRIVESSQNFPWLTKKLCIHIYDQIKAGKDKSTLIDENLNIEELFKTDLEKLSPTETSGIKYIAQRASDSLFFEASEVNDKISEDVINSLRDKRLIIRSGLNYNIYWDIFRDYLVTGEVPRIGESYIIRSSVNTCLEIFTTFEIGKSISPNEIRDKREKDITIPAIENSLIDLRNLGLVKKLEKEEKYALAIKNIKVTEVYFKEFITEKFKNYSIVNQLEENKSIITSDKIIEIFKSNFKGYSFQDSTWKIYANFLLNWIAFSNLKLKDNIELPTKGGGLKRKFYKNLESNLESVFPRKSTKQIIPFIEKIPNDLNLNTLDTNVIRDLALLGFVELKGGQFEYTAICEKLDNTNFEKVLVKQAYKVPKIKQATDYIDNYVGRSSAKGLLRNYPDILDASLAHGSKVIYAGYLMQWAKYIKEKSTLHNILYK
ncbi:restriction endonuclease [Carboxylicivirga taeanensis]|uniref:restriction endonuclease n=1 Tax=Carboxylicivirga taeanensis TaxID=1416875 RepID=UPI003F6DB95B